MSNKIIINSTVTETRVALIENDIVVELYIERKKGRSIVGNIYRGKVVRVLPGMQAAFVDIGLEKAAFLYVTDVYEDFDEFDMINGENSISDTDDSSDDSKAKEKSYVPVIEDILKEGQEILVQIAKEPIGTKGARITSHISLPGRYLVYLPTVDHIGISRRIEDEAERQRLKDIIENIRPQDAGFIIRTVSEGKSKEGLKADMKFLRKLWDNTQKKNLKASAPYLLHNDLNITLRSMRDLFTSNINKVEIDNKEEYKKAKDFVKTFMPSLKSYIKYYDKEEPIFDAYGIEVEIARALARKVWLKSGGYITIEVTEALVAVDVNTGKYVGKANLEDTILKTNLEAVKEIAYQLRLRNIGGIIIIDFIDMQKEKNKDKVFQALSQALAKDRTKTNILKISELGLVEMTRKRVRENITRILCESCFYCEGKGYIKSHLTVCYDIIREIKRDIDSIKLNKILVNVHPKIADLLYDEEYQLLKELEDRIKKKVIINKKNNFHIEQYDIMGIQ
jgi:ribonuclease G